MRYVLVYWRHFQRYEKVTTSLDKAKEAAWYLHDSGSGYSEEIRDIGGSVVVDHAGLMRYYRGMDRKGVGDEPVQE